MPFHVRIRRAAKLDIRHAALWYERQRNGLDAEFLEQIQAALDRVSRTGDVMPVMYAGLRRMYVDRFPYGIFYKVVAGRAVVHAVLHNRQSLSRLDERTSE